MKALTLWQPWASLVALGHKRFETRSWAIGHAMPLLIHAAARWDPQLARMVRVLNGVLPEGAARVPDRPPLGAIVAVANVVGCLPTDHPELDLGPGERIFGDYTPGRYAWQLADVESLAEPVPCMGAQRLWYPNEAILARVFEQVARRAA